jgi:glycerol dehydrogenase
MLIFGAPKRYVQGPGALTECGAELARLTKRVVLLVDPIVDELFGEAIAASGALASLRFGGEVTPDELQRLITRCPLENPGLVLAAGGGKCIDAGKALSAAWGVRIATAPTIASNDAPTSHIYVVYDNAHRLLSVEKLAAGNPDLVLVDTQVIIGAPRLQLIAGIGDAISKYFEVRQCMGSNGINVFGGTPAYTAGVLADTCYRLLREHTAGALAALERKTPDLHFERLVEATVLLSGLSFENGGLSIAHAMTRGLSAIASTASAPHGLQVAYGLLVQLTMEGVPQETLRELDNFYAATGLPRRLADLGLPNPNADALRTIAQLTLGAPHARHFKRALAVEDVEAAMRQVEGGLASDLAGNLV